MPRHGQAALSEEALLIEVPVGCIVRYREYFPGPQPELVVASVAEGNTRGQLWVDVQPARDGVALLWDKGNNVFYLGGRLASDELARTWRALIGGSVRQRAIHEGLASFNVRALSPSLESGLPALFQGVALSEYREIFLGFERSEPETSLPAIGEVVLQLIDSELLGRCDLKNLERVRSEVRWMWPSEQRFCEKGFGVVALLADKVIGWCTAEYVSRDRCGIGIETVEAHQNRGVGTAMAGRLVEECLKRRIRPHWECGVENPSSLRVAEKVGFVRSGEATFWAGRFENTGRRAAP